jgi:hypothetical protein
LCLGVLWFWGVRKRLLRVGGATKQGKQKNQDTNDRCCRAGRGATPFA